MGMLRMFVTYHEVLGDTPFLSLCGRYPVLPIDLAFLNTGKDWKSNEVAIYRRKLYHSLRDSPRLVERQLIKAQDRHEKWLNKQVKVSHLSKSVTINVNPLKRFQGRCTRPYADDVPEGVGDDPTEDGTGPLTEEDLPSTTFVERLSIGGEEAAISGVNSPIKTFWLSRAALAPEYGALIRAFEDADREKRDLPELRRNVRLIEANADVDDAEVLL
ncbi:hypothetical protein PC128_g6503 [Phytophthora cactorum]|nr:hypothetical protein PC128_g6503 [Phytophthora cactorum]